jgi:peptidylprolyl isomerase
MWLTPRGIDTWVGLLHRRRLASSVMRRTVPSALFVLVAALALTLSACGDDSNDGDGTEGAATKPKVEVPAGEPPKALEKKDLKEGSGEEAKAGQKVSVQYVGVAYSTKKEFDSSWGSDRPFNFTLGAGNVIKGWDEGVPGMKVGGRRQLVIPPDMAYGPEGYPGVIGPNETLVFVVDLVSINQ